MRSYNGPIGALLQVDELPENDNDGRISVHYVSRNSKMGSFMMLPSRLHPLKHIYLYVDEEEIENLAKNKTFKFKKVGTSALWEKALFVNNYEVAVIVNKATGKKLVLENPDFYDPYEHVLIMKPEEKNINVVYSRCVEI